MTMYVMTPAILPAVAYYAIQSYFVPARLSRRKSKNHFCASKVIGSRLVATNIHIREEYFLQSDAVAATLPHAVTELWVETKRKCRSRRKRLRFHLTLIFRIDALSTFDKQPNSRTEGRWSLNIMLARGDLITVINNTNKRPHSGCLLLYRYPVYCHC